MMYLSKIPQIREKINTDIHLLYHPEEWWYRMESLYLVLIKSTD